VIEEIITTLRTVVSQLEKSIDVLEDLKENEEMKNYLKGEGGDE